MSFFYLFTLFLTLVFIQTNEKNLLNFKQGMVVLRLAFFAFFSTQVKVTSLTFRYKADMNDLAAGAYFIVGEKNDQAIDEKISVAK